MKKTLFFLMLFSTIAKASQTQGSSLPYESWLKTLQESLSGPAAFSVALIGIFSCGATLIFTGGEIGRFMRSFIYIILVMTMLIGANSLMSNFFNGAVLANTTLKEEVIFKKAPLIDLKDKYQGSFEIEREEYC
jgi:type IV secretory pathway VirB2 component (pilin)